MESRKKIPFLSSTLYILIFLTGFFCRATFAQNQITFQVDMSLQNSIFHPGGGDIVVVRGSFNGWTGESEILEDPDEDDRDAAQASPEG